MKARTNYISPTSLWIVVRKRYLEGGLFMEPAWVGTSGFSGPVIFVSRILAEAYAYLRNKHHGPDDSDNWKAIGLHDFDLLEHAHGIDGPLHCMMTFGFCNDSTGALICLGAPRIRYTNQTFEISKDTQGVTFSFRQSLFDFIRDEWATLGLPEFEHELEAVDEVDAASFSQLAKTAIGQLTVCEEPLGGGSRWSVFSSQQMQWVVKGDKPPVMVNRSLH